MPNVSKMFENGIFIYIYWIYILVDYAKYRPDIIYMGLTSIHHHDIYIML